MNNENANEQIILNAYNNKIKIHLNLKDKTFRNGTIVKVEKDFFIINDCENGKESIFFLQVYNISPFTEPKNGGER